MKKENKKCTQQKCTKAPCACKKSLNHLSRIEGQIRTLKKYINEGQKCEKVAMLTTAIAKSFDGLRAKTLENFFLNEIIPDKKLTKKEADKINKIFKLYKK